MNNKEYLSFLDKFGEAVLRNDGRTFELYKKLIGGTEQQLARLGYVIAKGKYNIGGWYEKFDYPRRKNDELYAPVYNYGRCNWKNIIKINLDSFEEENPVLLFSNNLSRTAIENIKWIRLLGEMEYYSEPFGWFEGGRKLATKVCVNKESSCDFIRLSRYIHNKDICKKMTISSNEAICFDRGEKEYSVEICHLTPDNDIIILYRYTIDGFDQGERVGFPSYLY